MGRIQRHLREGNYANRIGTGAAVYMAAALEYVSAEILELGGENCKANKKVRITPRDIMKAVKEDAEFSHLLNDVHIPYAGVLPYIHPTLLPKASKRKIMEIIESEQETDEEAETELVEQETDEEAETELVEESRVEGDSNDGKEDDDDDDQEEGDSSHEMEF